MNSFIETYIIIILFQSEIYILFTIILHLLRIKYIKYIYYTNLVKFDIQKYTYLDGLYYQIFIN